MSATTNDNGYSTFALFGRLLLSVIFLLAGTDKIIHWNETQEFMAQHGMPAIPFLHPAAAATEIVFGLSLALGAMTRLSAFVLFAFLIPTTLIFHDFWNYSGAAQQEQ